MQCPACRHENPAQATFCLECGARLVVSCSNCRAELPPSAVVVGTGPLPRGSRSRGVAWLATRVVSASRRRAESRLTPRSLCTRVQSA